MPNSTADILLTVEHLSQMIDSATSQDCLKIIGRMEELKVKASLRLTAIQPSLTPYLSRKSGISGSRRFRQGFMYRQSGSIAIHNTYRTVSRPGRLCYFQNKS